MFVCIEMKSHFPCKSYQYCILCVVIVRGNLGLEFKRGHFTYHFTLCLYPNLKEAEVKDKKLGD